MNGIAANVVGSRTLREAINISKLAIFTSNQN
jgi:hypothetical protein